MRFGAFHLRANGDTAPLGVQAGLPRSSSPKSGGAFSDCEDGSAIKGTIGRLRPALGVNRHSPGRCQRVAAGPQSPLLVLFLMVATLLVVVTVGLFLTL